MQFYYVRTKNAHNIMAFRCNIYNCVVKEKSNAYMNQTRVNDLY